MLSGEEQTTIYCWFRQNGDNIQTAVKLAFIYNKPRSIPETRLDKLVAYF